ncbi:MAG: hypothetical protein N838_10400 [Thiohalocapsa sp. PB-PSB1]|jgi:hypothetical protein|nr:MAG: hypothetical protein N838_10400 [Thiohalocapsa sp. PB-PSB1]
MQLKNTFGIGAVILLALFVPIASGALNNSAKTVQSVDVHGSSVVIHLNETINGQPSCSKYSKIIACNTDDKYCELAFKIAVAAKLADKPVEFTATGTCTKAGATIFSRFRFD